MEPRRRSLAALALCLTIIVPELAVASPGDALKRLSLSGGWAHTPWNYGSGPDGADFWQAGIALPLGTNWAVRSQVMHGYFADGRDAAQRVYFTPIELGLRMYTPEARIRPYFDALPALVPMKWGGEPTRNVVGLDLGVGVSARIVDGTFLEAGGNYIYTSSLRSVPPSLASEVAGPRDGLNHVFFHLGTLVSLGH